MKFAFKDLPKPSVDLKAYHREYMRQYIKESRIFCETCKYSVCTMKYKKHLLTKNHILHSNP